MPERKTGEVPTPAYTCGCAAVVSEKFRSNHQWTTFVAKCPYHGNPLDYTTVMAPKGNR
jgi:hypothetical protein